MSQGSIPLRFTLGERTVAHALDPATPVSEVPARIALYFSRQEFAEPGGLVWLSDDGPVQLDPSLGIGRQVPAEAEIELRPGRP